MTIDRPAVPAQGSPEEPWAASPHDVLTRLSAGPSGLTSTEAERRAAEAGPNTLPPPAPCPPSSPSRWP